MEDGFRELVCDEMVSKRGERRGSFIVGPENRETLKSCFSLHNSSIVLLILRHEQIGCMKFR